MKYALYVVESPFDAIQSVEAIADRTTLRVGPLAITAHYTGSFSKDGRTIAGAWEICNDGKTWEHDFDITGIKA